MTPDSGSAGEKTEKATPKKREDARKKGQVLKSQEVNTAVMTMGMFATLYMFGSWMIEGMLGFMIETFDTIGYTGGVISVNDVTVLMTKTLFKLIVTLAPLFIGAIALGLVANYAQVGFLFVNDALMPKFSKINPIEGFKRIFSMRSLVEMLKAILKISIVGLIVYLEYMKNIDKFPNFIGLTVMQSAGEIFSICVSVAFKAVLALLALGLADYLYQWWEYEKNLRMSKEEIKQEYKQQEGDPMIKGKRREKQRQMSMMRMMQSIPDADVVITNPTHYAIAIRYKEAESMAPVVLAKGKDQVALKIKEAARENRIKIVENKPVAQALYVACEVGDKIPENMFAAVAEILAFVFRQRNPRDPAAAARENSKPIRPIRPNKQNRQRKR